MSKKNNTAAKSTNTNTGATSRKGLALVSPSVEEKAEQIVAAVETPEAVTQIGDAPTALPAKKPTKFKAVVLVRAIEALTLDRRHALEAEHFGCAFPDMMKRELAIRMLADRLSKIAPKDLPADVVASIPARGESSSTRGDGGLHKFVSDLLAKAHESGVRLDILADALAAHMTSGMSDAERAASKRDAEWYTKRTRQIVAGMRTRAKKKGGGSPEIVEFVRLPAPKAETMTHSLATA